jgi:hypothetical protein
MSCTATLSGRRSYAIQNYILICGSQKHLNQPSTWLTRVAYSNRHHPTLPSSSSTDLYRPVRLSLTQPLGRLGTMADDENDILGLKETKVIENPEQKLGSPHEEQQVDEDDICAICHLLLYKPVTTRCNHTLCEPCMSHWADVSVTTQMTTVGLEDEPVSLLPTDIETRCPMCRTSTTVRMVPGKKYISSCFRPFF